MKIIFFTLSVVILGVGAQTLSCDLFTDPTACPKDRCQVTATQKCIDRSCSSYVKELTKCPLDRCVKDEKAKSCSEKPPACKTYNGLKINDCPSDRCIADVKASTCAEKPSSGGDSNITPSDVSKTDGEEISNEGIPFFYIVNNDFFRIFALVFALVASELATFLFWLTYEGLKWVFMVTGT